MSDSPKRSILSIDNFWNVLTWIAMPLCGFLSITYNSGWGMLASFTLVPYILAKCNNIYFDHVAMDSTPLNEVKVFNKRGQSLSIHLPFKLSMVFVQFIFSVIAFVVLINIFSASFSTGFIIMFVLFWWPMSYFIKNNIPVSTFFNAKAWNYNEDLGLESCNKPSNTPSSNSSRRTASSLDNYYSPKKHYLSSNIYHRKR